MEKKDDLYFIEKVRSGQTQYFSYIVENYKDIVFSIALKVLKNRGDAEEMAQEVFIKVYKSLHKYKGTSKFSTWLYSVTYNHCISHVRKKKYEVGSLDDVQVKDEAEEANLNKFSDEERREYLEAALKKLSEEDYTLVILYYYQDQSIEEVAEVAKLSVSNTKVKLFRARKKLHTILNDMLNEDVNLLL